MEENTIIQFVTDTFKNVEVVAYSGDYFFFYDPDQTIDPDYKFPFITLITSDNYDTVSDLDRPAVYRLNIGLSKETFQALFGTRAHDTTYDFTALDRLMPHPTYGRMYWCCVLNPAEATLDQVKFLLAGAYQMTARKYHAKNDRS